VVIFLPVELPATIALHTFDVTVIKGDVDGTGIVNATAEQFLAAFVSPRSRWSNMDDVWFNLTGDWNSVLGCAVKEVLRGVRNARDLSRLGRSSSRCESANGIHPLDVSGARKNSRTFRARRFQ